MGKILCLMLVFILTSCAHTPKISTNETRTYKKSSTIEVKIIPNNPKPKPKPRQVIALKFPVRGAYISSEFGWRHNYYHRGVDLAAPIGSSIKACMDGTVVSAGRVKFLNGYGNATLIGHQNSVFTYYAHLKNVQLKAGTMVKQGDVIGTVGSTGHSTGPHLHLELIIEGRNHNPVPYFFIDSKTELAMLWLKGVKKSVVTGLGLKKLIGE